ncbi:MAG: flagellar basal body-associated FliL family protein [Thermoanaerobacteraceae bacterium]|nr:flagellar basal body-associated FliL family protein [Thermoanaerobacteraceae bacterium]
MAPKRGKAEEEEAVKGKEPKPWLVIVLVAALVIMSGGLVYLYLTGGHAAAGLEARGNGRPAQIHKLTLEDIVVNLSDPGLRRYLRTKITLEYSDSRLEGELNEKIHRVRDAVIGVLRSKKTGELSQEDALKRELLAVINSQLEGGQVEDLYFEEFIIQ